MLPYLTMTVVPNPHTDVAEVTAVLCVGNPSGQLAEAIEFISLIRFVELSGASNVYQHFVVLFEQAARAISDAAGKYASGGQVLLVEDAIKEQTLF